MPSLLGQTIRQRLARFLRGESSLFDFNAWFVPATWNVAYDDDPAAYDLTNELYLRIAEYANGHRTEAELTDRLRPLVKAVSDAR